MRKSRKTTTETPGGSLLDSDDPLTSWPVVLQDLLGAEYPDALSHLRASPPEPAEEPGPRREERAEPVRQPGAAERAARRGCGGRGRSDRRGTGRPGARHSG